MPPKSKESVYCPKCHKTMSKGQFYTTNNKEKYSAGVLTPCKKCIAMGVDNWDYNTYSWILQEADVPYIPNEWNLILEKYAKEPEKLKPTTVIGRYLGKMRLKKWKDYRWADTEFLQQLSEEKIASTMKSQGASAQEIATELQTAFDPPERYIDPPMPAEPDNYFEQISGGPDPVEQEMVAQLTEEDKRYLRLKWGKAYKPIEWITLEQMYTDFLDSYEIQTAGHIDTLKLICKTSLKANQLLDIGDKIHCSL